MYKELMEKVDEMKSGKLTDQRESDIKIMSNGFKKTLRQLYLSCRKLVLRSLVSPSEKVKSLPEDVNNILVFTMDRLGDLMCSLPVFEILQKSILMLASMSVLRPTWKTLSREILISMSGLMMVDKTSP